MSEHEEKYRQERLPPVDESLITNTRLREIEREQAEEKKRDAEYKERQLRFNKLMVIFTGGLLVANVIYDGLTWHLARTASISAHAAEIAATVASDSNKFTRQYMSASDGAFFFFAAEAVSYTPKTVRVSFRNQGKVAAKAFTGWIETGHVTPPLITPSVDSKFIFGGPAQVIGAFPHYEWIDMNLPAFSNTPEPPDRQVLPLVRAHISFDNGFGEVVQQDFCNYYWNGNWIECGSIDSLLRNRRRNR